MAIDDSVRVLLDQKGRVIHSVAPDVSVYEALEAMAGYDIGAVLVMANGELAGVFSERDYARKVILLGKTSRETSVGEIMSPCPVTVNEEQTIGECMHCMTEYRVRHLPVVSQRGQVIAVLSIGDLVNWTIRRQDEEIQQLNRYINGSYPS